MYNSFSLIYNSLQIATYVQIIHYFNIFSKAYVLPIVIYIFKLYCQL